MNNETDRSLRLSNARDAVLGALLERVEARTPLVVLRAPPGSGKTHSLTFALALAAMRGRRVAVATFTNAQADELSSRLARRFPRVRVVRWAAGSHTPELGGASVTVAQKASELSEDPCVVVATSSKWATSDAPTFDALFVDEAWQLPWAEFLLLGKLAATFVLVGDPGQIEPVVSVETHRWETAPRAPHRAAPEVLLCDRAIPFDLLDLPVTTRLPYDTAELVRSFYDFHFESWAQQNDRGIDVSGPLHDGVDRALSLLSTGTVAALTLPANEAPAGEDRAVAEAAAQLVRRALERGAIVRHEQGSRALDAANVGIVAAHRATVSLIERCLGDLAKVVRVDTPERWQGLERAMMVAVHPLSSVTEPSAFDLATGRLCVMASRHRAGLVFVTRDHVGATLARCDVPANHALGSDDSAGRGHARHEAAWRWLESNGRIVAA